MNPFLSWSFFADAAIGSYGGVLRSLSSTCTQIAHKLWPNTQIGGLYTYCSYSTRTQLPRVARVLEMFNFKKRMEHTYRLPHNVLAYQHDIYCLHPCRNNSKRATRTYATATFAVPTCRHTDMYTYVISSLELRSFIQLMWNQLIMRMHRWTITWSDWNTRVDDRGGAEIVT